MPLMEVSRTTEVLEGAEHDLLQAATSPTITQNNADNTRPAPPPQMEVCDVIGALCCRPSFTFN